MRTNNVRGFITLSLFSSPVFAVIWKLAEEQKSNVECNLKDGSVYFDKDKGYCVCDWSKCYMERGPEEECITLKINCTQGQQPDSPGTRCIPCPSGYFKNETGCDVCHPWTVCNITQRVAVEGDSIRDRTCGTIETESSTTTPQSSENLTATFSTINPNLSEIGERNLTTSIPDLPDPPGDKRTIKATDIQWIVIASVTAGILLAVALRCVIKHVRKRIAEANTKPYPKTQDISSGRQCDEERTEQEWELLEMPKEGQNQPENLPIQVSAEEEQKLHLDPRINTGDIMTGATCGAGDAHSSGTPDLAFGFCEEIREAGSEVGRNRQVVSGAESRSISLRLIPKHPTPYVDSELTNYMQTCESVSSTYEKTLHNGSSADTMLSSAPTLNPASFDDTNSVEPVTVNNNGKERDTKG